MVISKKMKEIIVNDVKYALKKMEESPSIEEKLYYFSAVHTVYNRVFNIEFSEDLLFAYFILNQTYQAFQQKLATMKASDVVFVIDDSQMQILTKLTKEYLAQFEAGNSTDDVLKRMVVVLYSVTGNGNYLMGKGFLKI